MHSVQSSNGHRLLNVLLAALLDTQITQCRSMNMLRYLLAHSTVDSLVIVLKRPNGSQV